MDENLIITIVIAMIAIIPGIWALINQLNKDKNNKMVLMTYDFQNRIDAHNIMLGDLSREIRYFNADGLFEKMYEKPTIVRCEHCKSPNVITSLNCIQCGAPLGV